jgi:hypothetical protein
MKLSISSEDLYNRILTGLDLMKNMSSSNPGTGNANPKLRVNLPKGPRIIIFSLVHSFQIVTSHFIPSFCQTGAL